MEQDAPVLNRLAEKPLVSVIIPTCNRPDLLRLALLSLVGQRYQHWQALVVNDAGEDVGGMVRAIDPRIRYISHSSNLGAAQARNTAVKAAEGEILCYLDDDDMYLPDHLQIVVDELKASNAGFVYTIAEYVQQEVRDGEIVELGRARPYEHIRYSKDRLHVSNFIPINCWAHRRELVDRAGLFDSAVEPVEDWDLLLRFSLLYDFIRIPKVSVEVHERQSDGEDHLTSRMKDKNVSNYKTIYERYPVSFNPALENDRSRILAGLSGQLTREQAEAGQNAASACHSRGYMLNEARASLMAERMVNQWQTHPLIHLLTVVQRGDEKRLADTLDCLNSQLYQGWGLSVISDMPAPDAIFSETGSLEWIQIGGRSLHDVMNVVISETVADWVAFIDVGDRLEPHLLFSCADYINRHADWQVIYVDHALSGGQADSVGTFYKPDFNPDMLLCTPYTGPFCLVKREALEQAGGFTQAPGVENYDLVLRIFEHAGESAIGHIAELLYHQLPANHDLYRQEQVCENGRQAVESHLARCGIAAVVTHGLLPASYFIDYQHESQPLVSIIIPTRDRLDILKPCVDSLLEKTAYPNYEVIIVDNNSFDFDTLTYMDRLQAEHANISILRYPEEYNYSAINNLAVSKAQGEYVVLLNNDTQVVQPNWLDRLLGHGQRKEVGIVGCRLLYPDSRVQHAGVVLGMYAADHIHIGLAMDDPGYMGRTQLVQNFSAVTAACLLIRKTVFEEVGGLDETDFKVLFNDVDLCLKVTEAGYRVVWTPYATLVHHGSSSIKSKQSDGPAIKNHNEAFRMMEKWLSRLANDPAYNRNLSLNERYPQPETDICPGWEPETRDRLRILGFPFDNWGCGEYRVKAPLRVLAAQGMAQTSLVPVPETCRLPELPELARLAPDTLLLQSFAHDKQLAALELYRKLFPDIFMVFELDDLKTDMPAKNPLRKTMYRDIRKRLRKALSLCDRMVVSTEPLRDAYSGMISDIVVVPNYLQAGRWSGLVSRRGQGDKPRVGWAGAQQHQGDLELLIDVVRTLKDEVDWVFLGMCPEEIKPLIREFHAGVRYDSYPEKLARLNLDLAVAPLEHNRFNEAKSNLRLLEYGIMGWPVVATDIQPYRGAPVTLVHNNKRAWIEAIRAHVHNPDAAASAGDQLQQWVKENWMLEDHSAAWMRALDPAGRGVTEAADPVQTATA